MEQILVPILTFVTTLCLGGAVIMHYRYRAALQRRLYRAGGQAGDIMGAPEDQPGPFASLLHWIGTRVSRQTSGRLAQELAQAGLLRPSSPPIYIGAKVVLLLVGFACMYALQMRLNLPFTRAILMVASGAGVFFFLPNIYLKIRRASHRTQIRHNLPDAVDLLEICVSAGMGLDMAWNLVADEIRQISPRLADEMALTNLEIHLGLSRADALRHMTQRTGADELTSLVAVLVQSERFGTSIGEVLHVFANTMRDLRSQRAEEQAEKMAVKMLFPMIVFIFPVILVVAIGPAVMIIVNALMR